MIKEFTDLRVWESSRKLTVLIYRTTASFPRDEQYGLTSQMRRAGSSAMANIAEGFGRTSKKDREHFYVMALGSLTELKSHALLARDLQYYDDPELQRLIEQQTKSAKELQALLRVHRLQTSSSSIQSQVSSLKPRNSPLSEGPQ